MTLDAVEALFDDLRARSTALASATKAGLMAAAEKAALGKAVRVDQAQGFTGAEQGQGRANLGAASTALATDALAGLIELATNAETLDGTDTVRALTSAGLASGLTLGTQSGTRRAPGGEMIHWGRSTVTTSANGVDHTASITFPVAFVGALPIVLPTGMEAPPNGSGDGRLFGAVQMTLSLTGAALTLRNNVTTGTIQRHIHYLAVGAWK